MVIVDPNAGHPEAAGLHPELQYARCMSNRYRSEPFPRCVSCTRRWAGDTCRFQAIRFFLKDSQRNIVGVSFVENQKPDAPSMDFPVKWNVPLEPVHFRRTKVGHIHHPPFVCSANMMAENHCTCFITHFEGRTTAFKCARDYHSAQRERCSCDLR
jgi:hypothetical protein